MLGFIQWVTRQDRFLQRVSPLIGKFNPDPERFDVAREPNRHLALGQGNHFCLGAQLAQAETEIALGSLIRRFPDLEGPTEPEGWRRSMVLRGPAEVVLRLS
jgi:cytochrome P450